MLDIFFFPIHQCVYHIFTPSFFPFSRHVHIIFRHADLTTSCHVFFFPAFFPLIIKLYVLSFMIVSRVSRFRLPHVFIILCPISHFFFLVYVSFHFSFSRYIVIVDPSTIHLTTLLFILSLGGHCYSFV